MTDKELKKLKRTELLELMLYLRRELDLVKQENETLRSQLNAHSQEQGNIQRELMETVRKTAQQVEQLCKAQNIPAEEMAKTAEEKTETEQ